jgi:hypothetical protein
MSRITDNITLLASNRKIIERCKIDTTNTQIHDHPLSKLGTGTSIRSDGVKLVWWAQANILFNIDINALK